MRGIFFHFMEYTLCRKLILGGNKMKKQKSPRKIRDTILTHIRNNSKDYIILLLTLIIGVILGVMFINNISNEQKQEITEYITSFTSALKEDKVIDKAGLLKSSIAKNISLAICLCFIGGAVILIPVIYGIVLFRGFCLGYTISATIGVLGTAKGIFFSIASLLLQNVIAIPAILALAMSGIRLYRAVIKDRKKENIKIEILRAHNFFWINAWNSCNIIICRNIYIFKLNYTCNNIYVKRNFKKIRKTIYNLSGI